MRDERDFDRFNAVNCKRVGCWRKTRRYDGCCTDSCLVAATHAVTSDRVVTATRSAGEVDRLLKGLLPTSPASSSSRYATGPVAPAFDPLVTSQVER